MNDDIQTKFLVKQFTPCTNLCIFFWGTELLWKFRWKHTAVSKFVKVEGGPVGLDIFFQWCGFRNYPYSSYGRSLEIPERVTGGGSYKPKILNRSMMQNWNFLEGWVIQTKAPFKGGGYGYFWNIYIMEKCLKVEKMTGNNALSFSTQLKSNKDN